MASPLTWYFPVILVPVIFGYCKMLLLCVCVITFVDTCVRKSDIFLSFFFQFWWPGKNVILPYFYCCRLCNPPDPAELSIVSPADRALGHISVWPWWRWFQDRWMPFALFVDTVEITWSLWLLFSFQLWCKLTFDQHYSLWSNCISERLPPPKPKHSSEIFYWLIKPWVIFLVRFLQFLSKIRNQKSNFLAHAVHAFLILTAPFKAVRPRPTPSHSVSGSKLRASIY